MPKVLTKESVLAVIAAQELGFRFADPQRVDENKLSVVLPIIRETPQNRNYITYPESDAVAVSDTGKIDSMRVHNGGRETVFIRSGTIFKGATQERALVRSAIVFPGKTVNLEVRCVHKSKGIAGGASTEYGGITPLRMDQATYLAGYKGGDQHMYWAHAEDVVRCMMSSSTPLDKPAEARRGEQMRQWRERPRASGGYPPESDAELPPYFMQSQPSFHDDLHGAMQEFSQRIADVLPKIKRHEQQVGLALITDKGVETIEAFDLPASWKALHEDAVIRMGSQLLGEDDASVFQYRPDRAIGAVCRVLGANYKFKTIYKHEPSNGEPQIRISSIDAKGYVGEVVELDERVIHLVLLKNA